MCDKQVHPPEWPMACVIRVKLCRDGLVHEVDLQLVPLQDKAANCFRTCPIHELALLVPSNNHQCNSLPF